jgi:oligoendopeptidase F
MTTTNVAEHGAPPEWDLSDLYDGPESPSLARDLDAADTDAQIFQAAYEGKLADLPGHAFGAAIAEYERLHDVFGRILSFAQLHYAGDMTDSERGRFQQGMQERVTDISRHLLFFTLEINRLDDAVLEAKLASPEAARYRPWLRDIRVFRPHQLSDELERYIHDKSVAGRAAWCRLFDETVTRLRFPVDGAMLTSVEALHLLSDQDGAKREAAARSLGAVLDDNVRLFTLITNTLAKDKEIEDRWRGYPQPWSYRNLSNHVEDAVVDALAEAVRGSYAQLSHRYYRMKARWLGKEALDFWDRNAPLPEAEREWTWDQARDTVLGAYGRFSPEMEAVGRRFFDGAWIHARPRPGKSPGAYAHPTIPSVHPYLLLSFLGKTRDVMTLAHELGHGVHQVLAAPHGSLMGEAPLTLAETASVFGEMLTFQAMQEDERDPARRKALLAGKVEDMINTVVRQVAFYEFERRLHQERRRGELSPEAIGDIWMAVQGESLGPAMLLHPEYRNFWAYIPHFIHGPFYVYAYAFGDCLVNSLYSLYRAGAPGFERHYMDLLAAGGTLRHKDVLAPFGLDAGDPAFWRRGLDVVIAMIDDLEKM